MARYIDADKAYDALNEITKGKPPQYCGIVEDCVNVIDDLPDADVVEVVRCKDCIYAFMTIDGEAAKYCDMFDSDDGVFFDKDFYCAYGERKEQT